MFVVCIIRTTEYQKTGSSRNKTSPSRYYLYHTRNGTSKDLIVAQQDATIVLLFVSYAQRNLKRSLESTKIARVYKI